MRTERMTGMMNRSMTKHYLGDSVYVQEEDEAIVLTTEGTKDCDGNPIISSVIYLEPETLCALQRYLLNRKVVDRKGK